MKELLEQGFGMVLIGAVVGMSIVTRIILFGYYGRLAKACKDFWKTNNKTVAYIRNDLGQRVKRRQGIKSTMLYTECRLAECKVCGIRIGSFECMLQQSLLVVLLCGVLTAFAGVLLECEESVVLSLLFISGLAVLMLLMLDLFAGLREKHKRVRLWIRDYVENCWSLQEEWHGETEGQEQEKAKKPQKEKRVAALTEKKRRKQEKHVKSRRGRTGKAQEEKRRLTEELLRERRQLEKSRFAEQRGREPEEGPEQQVQAEAAVTEVPETPASEARKMAAQEATETAAPEAVETATPEAVETAAQEAVETAAPEAMEPPAPEADARSAPEGASGASYETRFNEVLAEYLAYSEG